VGCVSADLRAVRRGRPGRTTQERLVPRAGGGRQPRLRRQLHLAQVLLAAAGLSPTRALPPPWRPSTPRRWAHLRLAGAPVRRRMRGHHGDGQSAATVAGSGFLGWSKVHRAARPVAGRPVGDPHWPVHVTLANMTRGADGRWSTVAGRWSTVAADERDLMRPAPAVDQADPGAGAQRAAPPLRGELSPATPAPGASGCRPRRCGRLPSAARRSRRCWPTSGSTRGGVPGGAVGGPSSAPGGRGRRRPRPAPAAGTRRRSRGGCSPAAGRTTRTTRTGQGIRTTVRPPPARKASPRWPQLADPGHGLTAHTRRFSRVDALAALADALPAGAASIAEIEQLCEKVLAEPGVRAAAGPGRQRGLGGGSAGSWPPGTCAPPSATPPPTSCRRAGHPGRRGRQHTGAGPGPGAAGAGPSWPSRWSRPGRTTGSRPSSGRCCTTWSPPGGRWRRSSGRHGDELVRRRGPVQMRRRGQAQAHRRPDSRRIRRHPPHRLPPPEQAGGRGARARPRRYFAPGDTLLS
jgi:hypothetical protein